MEIPLQNKYCNNTCHNNHRFDVQRKYRQKLCEEDRIDDLKKYRIKSDVAKLYLITIYGEKCMKCEWNERHTKTNKVPIQIHHIDGNWNNNKLKNLELLCPNCHSLSDTFGRLNKNLGGRNRK